MFLAVLGILLARLATLRPAPSPTIGEVARDRVGPYLPPHPRPHPQSLAGLIATRPIAADRTAVTMLVVRRQQTRVSPTVRDLVTALVDLGGASQQPLAS